MNKNSFVEKSDGFYTFTYDFIDETDASEFYEKAEKVLDEINEEHQVDFLPADEWYIVDIAISDKIKKEDVLNLVNKIEEEK